MDLYIDVIKSDPRNDCRPVWSRKLVVEAIDQITAVAAILVEFRNASNTNERIECFRKMQECKFFTATMLADELVEQLKELEYLESLKQ